MDGRTGQRSGPNDPRCCPIRLSSALGLSATVAIGEDFGTDTKAVETMWLPLVVGVDGSVSSLLALDWAVDEAARLALPLKILVPRGSRPGR